MFASRITYTLGLGTIAHDVGQRKQMPHRYNTPYQSVEALGVLHGSSAFLETSSDSAGLLVTVPPPVPAFPTVRVSWGSRLKMAVMPSLRLVTTVQVPFPTPAQSPSQPPNIDPGSAVAVSTTVVGFAYDALHVAPPVIHPGLLVTVPVPVPPFGHHDPKGRWHAFRPILQVATTREGSGVTLVTEQPSAETAEGIISDRASPVGEARWCSWWRRGRVELPVQKNPVASRLRA